MLDRAVPFRVVEDVLNEAEPGATAQRPQLSRSVLAHVPRQPGSWLTWDVSQIMFAPEIHILISRDKVVFTKKHETLELRPEVYFDHNTPPRVLSVGDAPSVAAGKVVRLFDGQDCDPDKALVLEAFFRYGLRKILGSRFSFAPKVSLEIGKDVVALLGGYHRVVLHHSLVHAGAVSTPYEKDYGRG